MYRTFGKRLLDVCLSLIGLCLALPVMIVAAILVKLDSPGPVFFKQRRMGLNGTAFHLLKFRSMRSELDAERKGFEPGSQSRVTKIGRMLRKTKLDEIPQLINVFMGDMSFVGPRPEVDKYKNYYNGQFADVLRVRPGITDMASIKYRNEEELLAESPDPQKTYTDEILPDKLQIALGYVRSDITFSGDMRIIMETISSVLERAR